MYSVFYVPLYILILCRVCVVFVLQCWCWPNRDVLCIEYSSGEGEGGGHPRCLPNSQEPQIAETPHGADTGEQLKLSKIDFVNTFKALFVCTLNEMIHPFNIV